MVIDFCIQKSIVVQNSLSRKSPGLEVYNPCLAVIQ